MTQGETHWGVDSLTPAGPSGATLYDAVVSQVGRTPEFWGRYIGQTGNLTQPEVDFLHSRNCRVLLIYRDTASKTAQIFTYQNGVDHANQAMQSISSNQLAVPGGKRVWIYADIEFGTGFPIPTADFFRGWSDTMSGSIYGGAGGVYGNTAQANAFSTPYCLAYNQDPLMRAGGAPALLWTNQPNQQPPTLGSNPPQFTPTIPPCSPRIPPVVIYQYAINLTIVPPTGAVDFDLANGPGFASMWAPPEEVWEAFLIGNTSSSTPTAFARSSADQDITSKRLFVGWVEQAVAQYVAFSDDNGQTWTMPAKLNYPAYPNYAVPDGGGILVSSQSTIHQITSEITGDTSRRRIVRRTWNGTWQPDVELLRRFQNVHYLSAARSLDGTKRGIAWVEAYDLGGNFGAIGETFWGTDGSTASDGGGGTGSATPWTNLSGALHAGDGSEAQTGPMTCPPTGPAQTTVLGDFTNYIVVTGMALSSLFGVGFPVDGSFVITRIILRHPFGSGPDIFARWTGGSSSDPFVNGGVSARNFRLVKGGVIQGVVPTTKSDAFIGPYLEWPATGWTVADLRDPGFGVAVQGQVFTQNTNAPGTPIPRDTNGNPIVPGNVTFLIDYLTCEPAGQINQRIRYAEIDNSGNFIGSPEDIVQYGPKPATVDTNKGQTIMPFILLRWGLDNVPVVSWFIKDTRIGQTADTAWKAIRSGGIWSAPVQLGITAAEIDAQWDDQALSRFLPAQRANALQFVSLSVADQTSILTDFKATERNVKGGSATSIALDLRKIRKPISDTTQRSTSNMYQKFSPAFWFDANYAYFLLFSKSSVTNIFRAWLLRGTIKP